MNWKRRLPRPVFDRQGNGLLPGFIELTQAVEPPVVSALHDCLVELNRGAGIHLRIARPSMQFPEGHTRIWLSTLATDMRKRYDGRRHW